VRFGGRDEPSIERQTVTRLDHLEDTIKEHINQDLVPRISEHHRISVATDPVAFLYYNRLSFGRRCSCWNDVDAGPDKQCPVCFGMGYVTGFKKYGCIWECLDVTAQQTTMVNVAPNYDSQRRPVSLSLINGAVRGYIEWSVQIQSNGYLPAGETERLVPVDALRLGAVAPRGTMVVLYVRDSTESSFTEVTGKDQVEDRLLDANGNPETLTFRVLLARAPQAKSPSFTYLHFRYRTREDISVSVDIPRDQQSITLSEMGLYDSWQVMQMVFGNKLRALNTEDFFVRVRDNTRWKLTELTPFKPEGHLVGYDGTARLVQKFENYHLVP